MKLEHFVKVVEEALASLPKEFRTCIRNVAVLVEDIPPNQPSPQPGQQRPAHHFPDLSIPTAYSGHPIRVRAIVHNRNGYSCGVEFVASSDQERKEIACLRENLQTLSHS